MNEYKNLLDVAINNEKNLQQQQDTINYNKANNIITPPPVQERAPSEIVQDVYTQKKMLMDSLARLNINYDVIRSIINEFSAEDIVILNAHFPLLKNDIEKRFNVKLLTADFLLSYLFQYLDAYEEKIMSPDPDVNRASVSEIINNDDDEFGLPSDSKTPTVKKKKKRFHPLNQILIHHLRKQLLTSDFQIHKRKN
jgi:hypothetical protein